MIPTPEYVALIHRERTQEIEQFRLGALAARARACCTASVSLVQRIVRALRPAPAAAC
jgi:hypothetical protein